MSRLLTRTAGIDRRTFLKGSAAAGLALSPLAAGCSVEPSSDGLGRRLVIRQTLEMEVLDPAFAAGRSDYEVMACVYEGLVGYEPGTTKQVDTLAEEFEVNDDGTLIRFRLRKGVQFHGGYGELTAADVKFSFERTAGVNGHKLKSPYEGDWGELDEVRVTGRHTGEIRMKQTFAPLFKTTLPLDRGYILSERATTERGETYATHPIGTGPYEFIEWKPRQYALLRRFKDYAGSNEAYADPVIWDEIEIRGVENDNSAAIGLTTGEIDYGLVAPIDAPRLRDDGGFAVEHNPSVDYSFIGMNQAHEKLKDKRVREAIRAAIDVDSIIAAAFDDAYERATAIIPPNMGFGHWKDAPVRKPDPERARSLLEEAGATGTEFTLTTATDQQAGDVVLQVVQANLRDIGIDAQIELQDSGTFFTLGGKTQAAREIFYTGFSSLPDPFWSMVWFTRDQLGKWNFQGYDDKEFDALNQQATETVETRARDELYVRMQQRWDDACNTVWVTWPTVWYAGNADIEPSIRADGRMLPWNFRRVS